MKVEQPVHEAAARLRSCVIKRTVTATGGERGDETHKERLYFTAIRPLEDPKPSTNKPATKTEVEELLGTKIREKMEKQRTPEAKYEIRENLRFRSGRRNDSDAEDTKRRWEG